MEDLFVLDFFNLVDDIKIVFDFFYIFIMFFEVIDVNVFYELKDDMDDIDVYEWFEVEEFNKCFFEGWEV